MNFMSIFFRCPICSSEYRSKCQYCDKDLGEAACTCEGYKNSPKPRYTRLIPLDKKLAKRFAQCTPWPICVTCGCELFYRCSFCEKKLVNKYCDCKEFQDAPPSKQLVYMVIDKEKLKTMKIFFGGGPISYKAYPMFGEEEEEEKIERERYVINNGAPDEYRGNILYKVESYYECPYCKKEILEKHCDCKGYKNAKIKSCLIKYRKTKCGS